MKTLLFFLLLIISLSVPAQITTDGTLGSAQNLSGPDYQIGADLGQQRGGNLFHSFQDFNLQSWESATFSGPNHIQNVISRVTGGNPSNIDGLFRSIIPGADVYFLNPYGIMFGPNARLDVQGSFHASTADYLRLGDGGRFDARNPSESILTVAPIESFGFLEAPAPISIQGHGEVTQDWENSSTGLSVPEGETLSLIGGQIDISRGTFFQTGIIDDSSYESIGIKRFPIISAPYGQINLIAVASQGEVRLGGDFMEVSSFNQLADIYIKENSLLQTSGEGGGNIFIRGRHFLFDNGEIESDTLGNQDGGIINLQVNTFSLIQGAIINSITKGTGRSSSIEIRAKESITVAGENTENTQESAILAVSGNSRDNELGDIGKIYLEAKNIVIKDGGGIGSSTQTAGNGGNITIRAFETISVTGDGKRWEKLRKSWDGSYIASASYNEIDNAGNAGEILMEANNILFLDGSYIYSTTEGKGIGGMVTLKASETVTFAGKKNSGGYPSRIHINTSFNEGGDAGNLVIEAQNILFQGGAYIDSTTTGKGHGGNITLQAIDNMSFNNSTILGYTSGKGTAAEIVIDAGNLSLNDSWISGATQGEGDASSILINVTGTMTVSGVNSDHTKSGVYASSSSSQKDAGMAGNITIEADTIHLSHDGQMTTEAQNAGGGNITLHNNGMLYLQNGTITTSVHGGLGDGGNITIEKPQFVVLNQGQIKAQADAGQGGNIRIVAEQFIKSYESLVSASSRLGLDGNVQIHSPAIDLDAMLVVLPGGHLEAQLKTCNIAKELDNPNTFIVKPRHRSHPFMK
jgi:filamentous hemagglutinin family protein